MVSSPTFDFNQRGVRVRQALTGLADTMVVTKAANVRWLTGFSGSWGTVVITPTQTTLITDGRYQSVAAETLAVSNINASLRISSDLGATLQELCAESKSVALEANHVTWSFTRQAEQQWFTTKQVVPTSDLIEELRAIKEPAEVTCIQAAAAIADAALAQVLPLLVARPTELEVARALVAAMAEGGSPNPAFATIVAAGANAALPHHEPSDYRLSQGDLVVIDMGATSHGYCSDMTRTFCLGEPSPQQNEMLAVVQQAHDEAIAMAAPGVPTKEVDAKARQIIAAAGWAEFFVHPTGHGLGLEIHEPLRLSTTSNATLAQRHVVTVEPGVYIPGQGGVRIEDTIEITSNGAKMLTRASLPTVVN